MNAIAGGDKPRSTDDLLKVVIHSLEEDKAIDIVPIDLEGKTSIADFMVVASGGSTRQVGAIADHLMERIKLAGFGNCRIEGRDQGDWVVIDAVDIVVHVFRPEVRDFYNLEKLWSVVIPADAGTDHTSEGRAAI